MSNIHHQSARRATLRGMPHPIGAAVLAMAALLPSLRAYAAEAVPLHATPEGVVFASGGIGTDESALMRRLAREWPASFEFAVRDGSRNQYAADVVVTVRSASGRPVLSDVRAQGPFMLARLAPGLYQVEATLGGRTLRQRIDVGGQGPS
ncbi:hypothetical protein [Variovorax sp. OV329]|uniref:hypothetical protein n=1 Tax=Variovorax sp. OV329 TaxID=1882825 RepID=UPI000B89BAD8|nr:hypothetical protein [Variovorax sp. OV329]